ncbi:gamma-glutamyl-gamma-aminobutyrate hydrolase family protein [Streptosporangium sp. NBC_01755]|uniref:anthranilate synthase component II n=1 Tax=unclassified Streptosporangium TaxID=2632669 RepID=UPI002DD87323|nr:MULTISPECIES: gamma-glutamyl-gamma-aminobutyrate hydrolase family protein [unclassified Streptosporangium]WSA25194.1 gamma-glutamyl-gamma-aminobutyrate hydrolase family protein [Streptosporangium sp. NBC_01810]WSD03466.1 gamma-glutamyl-gamma-aminobutyrate hydrolase family protein [Streptosporangium sp. NBC_01755]
MSRVLVVDNHDSFVHTIVQYLRELGATCDVRPRDRVRVEDASGFDGVLISPGPGTPENAGVSVPLVGYCEAHGIPLLGVCLGHQAIAVAHGATVSRAPELVHGRTSAITHDGRGVFTGLPSPATMTRYHSLAVLPGTVPEILEVTATTGDGVIMGLRHRTAPVEGVQFHPESVISQHGHRLLGNWLERLL